ncbi:hypothetical protein AV955_gp089 [Diadromus pulchellus ascovirus 4a]|uniref:DNA-directed RNA polymerase subunit n=1 Tax=Diadromus pulchellus ascovirus 4a TaxID=158683 RepID=F2NZ18_9VIRU|nr:hypothetical protein AV955_gp089 [Diadromus pulchellus ascovirus 4a]CCA61446.1 unnamed protein product [Diadromus pulchellus ascovirus 4a]
MSYVRELKSISFAVSSPEDIRNKSVYEVKSIKLGDSKYNTIYDPRGGALFGKACETCKQHEQACTGHFGHIELNAPVVHPLFFNHVFNILKVVCSSCSRLLVSRQHLEFSGILKYDGERRLAEIINKVKKFKECFHCGVLKREYTIKKDPLLNIIQCDGVDVSDIEIKAVFDDIDAETLDMLNISHPRNCCLEVFPVIPPCCRPYEIVCNTLKEDDLSRQLVEIVKANLQLKDNETNEALIHNLKLKIETYCRSPKKKGKLVTCNGEQPVGIRERLTGKTGQMRDNLMGKRTEMSSRTVIGPDPTLRVDEVGVPEEIVNNTTFPEIVYPHNIEYLKQLVKTEKIEKIKRNDKIIRIDLQIYEDVASFLEIGDVVVRRDGGRFTTSSAKFDLEPTDRILRCGVDVTPENVPVPKEPDVRVGDSVLRKIRNGDWVLMNRQPTLWKGSMMAFKCRIHKSRTFTFNLAVCKAFNADFDGDEQNGHFPQSIEAVVELMSLSTPKHCLLSSTNGTPVIVVLQDALLGAYLITDDDGFVIDRDDYNDLIMHLTKGYDGVMRRRRQIRATLKSRGLPCAERDLRRGKNIVSLLFEESFNFKHDDFEIDRGVVVSGRLSKAYLGSSHNSIMSMLVSQYSPDVCMDFLNDIQFMTNKWMLSRSFSINLSDFRSVDGVRGVVDDKLAEAKVVEETIINKKLKEAKINGVLPNAKDLGMKISTQIENNNMVTTILSGSKGDYFNLGQVKGLLGQQIINSKRIPTKIDNGTRSLPHYPRNELSDRDRYESRGFIMNGFYDGLNVKEFFFHAMSGRQGVCDTAMTTFMSGYNMRKLVKLTEDIKIQNDRVVADSSGCVYDFSYGPLGFNPENGVPDVDAVINKIVNS